MSVQEAERSLLSLPTSRIDGRCKETELTHIKRRLSKKKLAGQQSKTATPTPRRFLSPEIAKLTSQINDKLNPANFSQETHLAKTDPGYGTPQVNIKIFSLSHRKKYFTKKLSGRHFDCYPRAASSQGYLCGGGGHVSDHLGPRHHDGQL